MIMNKEHPILDWYVLLTQHLQHMRSYETLGGSSYQHNAPYVTTHIICRTLLISVEKLMKF